jgi:mono/diheme cytochrome c family protein
MRFFTFCVCCWLVTASYAREPQLLFMMECQGCHMSDGRGGVNAVPSMNQQVAQFLTVPGGREFLAQVPGIARSGLNDAEVTAVLNWLLNEFGPQEIAAQYPPYTVEEISHLRKTPLTEVKQKRAALLKLIEAKKQS